METKMAPEEKLIRISLIHTIFQFYKPGELSKNGNKVRKHARIALKQLSKRVGAQKSIQLIQSIDPIWKSIFERYKDRKFVASTLICCLWKDELNPYISDRLLEKYAASEIPPSNSLEHELLTYEVADSFDKQIKGILNEEQN